MKTIKILIADDALIKREGLKSLNACEGLKIVGEVGNVQDTLISVKNLKPDVVLMDLKWFGDETAGIAEIALLKRERPSTKIIAVSAYADLLHQARNAGADAAVESVLSIEEIASLIRAVHATKKEKNLISPSTDRTSPIRLASGILLPIIGFVIVFLELVWAMDRLSLEQFWLVFFSSAIIYFWAVIFVGRYVNILSETSTYQLFEKVLRFFFPKARR